jgi:hypothetical protein
VGNRRHPAAATAGAEALPDRRMFALVGRDRLDLRRALGRVQILLVTLEREDEVPDGVRPEQARDEHDRPDPHPRTGGLGHVRAECPELVRPDLGVATLVSGDRPKGICPPLVLLDPGQRVIQRDRITLELQVLQ